MLLVNGIALLAVTTLLRCWHLENIPGINGDEAWSGVQALKLLHGEAISWRTPSGNPINPFFFLPLVALHAILPPSFLLLRIIPLVSGLAALVTNYYLCRRAFDTRTAAISTLLLAALPIDVAYSRFAWDASQSLLATILVMYLPLIHARRSAASAWPVAAMVAFAAAILVHPTNVFAAPLLVVPILVRHREQLGTILHNARVSAAKWPSLGILAASAAIGYFCWPWVGGILSRLRAPAELSQFAVNYLHLFSGTTVYDYITGANAGAPQAFWSAATDLTFACAALFALCGLFSSVRRGRVSADSCFVTSWFVMLLGFYVVAGPGAIAPHYERYGICLIAPGALLISRGLAWWIDARRPRAGFSVAVSALAVWLWPVSFYLNYFEFVEQTGGRAHRTFQTASVEPKLAALRYVLSQRDSAVPGRIVCHEWWNYWPLEYLALGEENLRVFTWDEWHAALPRGQNQQADPTWFVEFSGSAAEAEAVQFCVDAELTVSRHTICDYAGRQLISVITPGEKFLRNY